MKTFIQRMTHWWQLFTNRFPKSVEILIVGLSFTLIHAIAFLSLQPVFGHIIASFALVPVLIFAWFYGMKAGIYATIIAFSANILLITHAEQSPNWDLYVDASTLR